MIQICDLKVVKAECPTFRVMYKEGMGAYSHFIYNGCNHLKHILAIYGTDTYG